MPTAYRIRYKTFRACSLKKFPYVVYYELFENKKEIEVVAVLHKRRNWKNKL